MTKILSGSEVAEALKQKIISEVKNLKQQGFKPVLCIVMVGKQPDSVAYVKSASKKCETMGIGCRIKTLPEDIREEELIKTIQELNEDKTINGIMIMLPLPTHISQKAVKYVISPEKDVDCLNPVNVSKVMSGEKCTFTPCTPSAVMEILKHYGIDIQGKKAVIIGRSMVVGRPLAMMLLKENATVTICHTKTVNLKEETRRADILVAAAGKPKMVKKDMVGEGAIVIDVGINFDEDGKMCGDVDFDGVRQVTSMITPVPKGVGSVTSTVLMKHVIEACKQQNNLA